MIFQPETDPRTLPESQTGLQQPLARDGSDRSPVGDPDEERTLTTRQAAEEAGMNLQTFYKYASDLGVGHQIRPRTHLTHNQEDIQAVLAEQERRRDLKADGLRKRPKTFHYPEKDLHKLAKGLAEIESPEDETQTFRLRGAADFVAGVGQQVGVRIHRSLRQSLGQWTLLALDEAIQTRNTGVLSPTSAAIRGKSGNISFNLTAKDLGHVLGSASHLRPAEGRIEDTCQAARERLLAEREANVTLTEAAQDLNLPGYQGRRQFETMLARDQLSLPEEYPLLTMNTVGIPPDLYENQKEIWERELAAIKEEKKTGLHPRRRLQLARQEEDVQPMGSLFQTMFAHKTRSLNTTPASLYLNHALQALTSEAVDIEINLAPGSKGVSHYCHTTNSGANRLRALFEEPPEQIRTQIGAIKGETERILQQGFTDLAEYQQYCPDDFPISLSKAMQLLGIPMAGNIIGANANTIIKALSDFGLEVREVDLGTTKKNGEPRRVFQIPLGELAACFEDLTGSGDLKEKLLQLKR